MSNPLLLSALLAGALLAAPPAMAEEQTAPPAAADEQAPPPGDAPTSDAPTNEPVEGDALERHRTPVEALTERMIGSASRAVRFDWRKSPLAFGITGSELLERNNFGSTRLGGFIRRPFGNFLGELAVTHVFSWGTDSTEKLALTPYRQFGRPSRFELDLNVGYPLAEGVATALPSFIPPTEFVISAQAGFRYLFYPGGQRDLSFLKTVESIFAPRISDAELANLEATRPGGMQIDSARYGLLAGIATDIYVQPGFFLSPRMLVSVPLLSPMTGTGLGFWWELSLGMGWAL